MEFRPDYFTWVAEHLDGDPFRLRLKYLSQTNHAWWLPVAIDQIACRHKAERKLISDGIDLMPAIIAPGYAVEQCSSAQAAQLHATIVTDRVGSGGNVLDMTCGLGIDAMSMAKTGLGVTAIESNELQAAIARYNFKDYRNVEIVHEDSVGWLKSHDACFDALFVDPGRRDKAGNRFYSIADCSPNILELEPLLREHTNFVLAKLSPMLDVTRTLLELPGTTRLHLVGLCGECKEMLVEIDFKIEPLLAECIPIMVHDLDRRMCFNFTLAEERDAGSQDHYGMGVAGDYLYEPSAAVMKAGCFNLLALRYGMTEAAPSSHLFFSQHEVDDFPGKCYIITEVSPFDKASQKAIIKRGLHADVTVRNFPVGADELSRKLKIRSGNEMHLFATTDAQGRKVLIIARLTSIA